MTSAWDLTLPSPAKINLGLYVLGKRPDGYHEIWTILQELEFHDTLYFSQQSDQLMITTDHSSLPIGEENLVYRAIQLLSRTIGCPENLAIHIQKNIPLGAGLGGGSSNAATTLRGMNQLFQLGLTQAELVRFGAELGSDVPFFLYGGTALATGRGEQIQSLSNFPKRWILLVNPGIHISSGWAYKNVNLKLTNSDEVINLRSQIQDSFITGIYHPAMHNMLEEPVIEKYPIIQSIKIQLLDHGAEWAMMSGSGSTVFGIFSSQDGTEHALRQIARSDWLTVVTRTV